MKKLSEVLFFFPLPCFFFFFFTLQAHLFYLPREEEKQAHLPPQPTIALKCHS